MNVPYRTVLCKLDHAYSNSSQGLVEVLYEKIGDFYYQINEPEFFCDTSSVFITKGYEDIEEKYQNQIFELKAYPSRNELKDGDCRYISTIESVSPVTSNFSCAEIFESQPPEPSSPTISIDKQPLTSQIFLQWDNNIYGPFHVVSSIRSEFDHDLYEIKLETKPIEIKSSDGLVTLPSYHYFHIEQAGITKFVITTKKNEPRQFISSIRDIMNLVSEDSLVDFISDETIVSRYGTIIANSAQIRNFTKGHVRLIKDQVTKLKEYKLNRSRFEKLFELFEYPELWGRERSSMMEEFFATENGEQFISRYLSENKDALIAEKLSELESEIAEQSRNLKDSIADLEERKHKIEASIRTRKQELQSIQDEDLEAKVRLTEQEKNALDTELKESREELNMIQTELEKLKSVYDDYHNLDELTNKRQSLRGSIREFEDDLKELETQRDKITEEIEDKNNQLLGKLVNLKPKVDMLSGVLPSENYSPIEFKSHVSFKPQSYNVGEQQQVLEGISDQLLSFGRKLDFEDLTNVVISLAQSQFTLFSGLPGTGKTSLGKLLGKAMGLENRLLNIPVARGWTSQRDVIGFYNTLSQSYVPSASGLYDLLSQVQEPHDGDSNAPSIVLLDEFNLSQPEHYFSPFMEMADPESNRTIYTGDPKNPQLSVPNYVRFLGTINNDESVQSLTPRMLDRSAVIHFDDQVTSSSIVEAETNSAIEKSTTLSGNDFIRLFNSSAHSLPADISSILDDIIGILVDDNPALGSQVIVSYRKVKAISNYYNVASSLMISEKLTALDYAVSQHIIPLISGYGEGFGERLEKLQSIIPSDMEKCKKRLSRIISKGEQDLNTYGAFL